MLRLQQNGISKAIQAIREELQLTQEEFAELLSVSRVAVHHWEKGDRSISLHTLREVSKVSGVAISLSIEPSGRTRITIAKKVLLPSKELSENS